MTSNKQRQMILMQAQAATCIRIRMPQPDGICSGRPRHVRDWTALLRVERREVARGDGGRVLFVGPKNLVVSCR